MKGTRIKEGESSFGNTSLLTEAWPVSFKSCMFEQVYIEQDILVQRNEKHRIKKRRNTNLLLNRLCYTLQYPRLLIWTQC